MTSFRRSRITAFVGAVVAMVLASCAGTAGSWLRPSATARSTLHLDTATVVDTGSSDGRVYLPAGTYRAVGENEKGTFLAAPNGIGIRVQLTTMDLFTVASGTLGLMTPGGVCVRNVPLKAEEVTSYATWRAALKNPEVPIALSVAQPQVRFKMAPETFFSTDDYQ